MSERAPDHSTRLQERLQDERARLRRLPRVRKAGAFAPVDSGKYQIQRLAGGSPDDLLRTFGSFIEYFPPGGHSQKHGHQNEAMFYILEGRGYDVHDGKRYDWEAGDVVIVPPGCVHQHFNADPERPARALVINPKPTYLFMNLIHQALVERAPGGGGWVDEPDLTGAISHLAGSMGRE
jgi:mannose-6-phosphate isomerase-like protein (cupin superfamily)